MKIASHVTEVLEIKEESVNIITFEDTALCGTFIQDFMDYMTNKPVVENQFAHFISDDYETISPKNFHPIILNCGDRNLLGQKLIEEKVYQIFEEQIINYEKANHSFLKFEQSLIDLKNTLGIYDDDYQIELQPSIFKLRRLLKLFGLDFHNELEDLSEINKRKAFIDLLIHSTKENILIVLFPESHLGIRDIEVFMQLLKKYHFTTIVFTNHPSIIINEENIFLCKSNKECHDIEKIKEELSLFIPDEMVSYQLTHMIAYHEFVGENLSEFKRYFKFINHYN
ncbi:hypothetical protein GZH82_09740 [Staphylococcus ursi]|uniref:hypothetical protein n=1 Tax=Staphylococcus sp. MI 10-1553 TaxID=1912064 RepID=UPI001399665C|nr:hypothetical protein [Staphylococcus sp. MI 10-1553]QHW37592.1 hypothetical protein GZH82_09740 [Staphylococcus sp. MI 10-1553]